MKFKILHLSDIHISSKEDNNHKILRDNLIDYIKKINEIDVIVISGDIVDRYDVKAFDIGKEFIDRILETVELTKDRLVIVPGNHDMKRDSIIEKILDEDELKKASSLGGYEGYIKPRMQGYVQFVESLGLDYGIDNQYGYGIRLIEIKGKMICFNLLNSSWSNKGNDDYKHLFIGREQLEYNRNKIREQKIIDFVISVMHHPLSWLLEEEKELLKNYLVDKNKLGSAIVLHGHVHNVAMQAEESPSGKIVSLISGIGYPKSGERTAGQPKISSCRFSVYELDMIQKKIDCCVFSSTENGKFAPDCTLYDGSEDGHYSMYWNKEPENLSWSLEKYIDLDPIPVTKCWCGREEELELFSRDDVNVIAISGVGGQGKTALAAEFMHRDAESGEKFEQRVWVDCRELQDTIHVKLLKILELLTDGKESAVRYKDEQLKETIKRFLRYIKQHRIMIVFDNIDAYVTFDTEELIGELKDVVDGVLMQQSYSLIVLTCRTSIYDSKANFKTIHLDGLKEPEGIDYFKGRGISLNQKGDLDACKEMIQITKGHPWWIGLICGQMIADHITPENYLEQNRESLLTHKSQLEQYFSSIWEKLGSSNKGEMKQKIIRYLVESTRPLTILDLSNLINENRNQTNKAINHLYHIGLVIEHDSISKSTKSYQIHPLVREYIHRLYSSVEQRPYVLLILELLMGRKLYNIIFGSETKKYENIECNVRDIIDSIETCLNSRNASDALDLMTYSFNTLSNNGCLAEYVEIAGRILDKIDWEKEQITQIKQRSEFLYHYLDVLSMQEYKTEKVHYYLSLYERNCEKNTIAYSGYLATKANVMWRLRKHKEAYMAILEYNNIKDKYGELRCPTDIDNLNGMILRECGRIDEALEMFERVSESVARQGNIARCFQKQGNYIQALGKLKECLNGLEKRKDLKDLNDNVNVGYAYFWIAEIYFQQLKYEESIVFMTLCQEIWKEYAPGLLGETEELLRELEEKKIEVRANRKEQVIGRFMNENFDI